MIYNSFINILLMVDYITYSREIIIHSSTVITRANVIHYILNSSTAIGTELNQRLNSQKTPHILPSRATYGMSFVFRRKIESTVVWNRSNSKINIRHLIPHIHRWARRLLLWVFSTCHDDEIPLCFGSWYSFLLLWTHALLYVTCQTAM